MNFAFRLHSNCLQDSAAARSMFLAAPNQPLAGIQLPALSLDLLLSLPLLAHLLC
jgi:hypothetical protein